LIAAEATTGNVGDDRDNSTALHIQETATSKAAHRVVAQNYILKRETCLTCTTGLIDGE
jgi:hypothetical protein